MLTNIVELHNGYVEIIVKSTNKRNAYKHSVFIDIEDLEKIGKIRISKTGYVYQAKRNGRPITNTILNFTTSKDMYIDHIDGNTLNNRKENLRVCTPSENARNRHSFTRNNTGTVGIAYRENGGYRYFRVSLVDNNGRRFTKQFNINKLGKNKAFLNAQGYLKEMKLKYNYIV